MQYASSANAPEGSWKTLWAQERVTQANYDDWPVQPGETRCYRVRAEYRGEDEDVLSTSRLAGVGDVRYGDEHGGLVLRRGDERTFGAGCVLKALPARVW